MADAIFARQDSIGLIPWSEFARRARVPSLEEFERCVVAEPGPERVGAGRVAGADFGVEATPTVLVNGWRLGTPPSDDALEKMVERIGRGEPPVGAVR
jgi:hypothetical protein